MYELIPIHHLDPGQIGEVGQLIGDAEQIHRMEELGLRQGTIVEMVQPGSPCIIRLDGTTLCFRDGNIYSVLVRPGEVT